MLGDLAGIYDKATLILALTITPLHVGTGRGHEGFVDLPIQRDKYGYPCIWSSSFKGALRSSLTLRYGCLDNASLRECEIIKLIFGPEKEEVALKAFAGSVSFTDLKLLAIPGPCGAGVCLYTSEHLLESFIAFTDALGMENLKDKAREALEDIKAQWERGIKFIVSSSEALIGQTGALVIPVGIYKESELKYSGKLYEFYKAILNEVMPDSLKSTVEELARKVIVIDKSRAPKIIGHKLIVQTTRVALDYRTKKVIIGALWSEEYVPEFAIFYGGILCSKPREKSLAEKYGITSGEDVFNRLRDLLRVSNGRHFYLFLGGLETIGRGLVRIVLLQGGRS